MSEGTLAAGAAPAENPAPAPAPAQQPAPAPAEQVQQTQQPAGDGGKPAPIASEQEGIWGNDWRDKLAKGDAKRLENLKRFASPDALLQSYEEAARKISEGVKPKGKPGDKATDEEWAAYRKDNSIPDKVEDFVKAIALPDKRQIGEADLPVVNAFAERAIKSGVSPADMSILVDEYYQMQEEVQYQQATTDADFKKASLKTLREEWGGDYDGNLAAMRPYFDSVDAELYDNLFGGRMADGSKIGNHPAILRFFATKAVAENPMSTVLTPGSTGMQDIDNEIAALEKRMGEDRAAWFKDEKAQERLRSLYRAKEKIKA